MTNPVRALGTYRGERHPLRTKTHYRYGAGLALPVVVVDLAREGCKLENIPREMTDGHRISLRIGCIGPLYGTIRWTTRGDGGRAGLEFETPLHPAVLEDIVERLGVDSTAEMSSA